MLSSERDLKECWKQLITQGVVPETIRPLIQESWQRVHRRISPDQKPPLVTESATTAMREWKPLTTASSFLDQLDTWVRDRACEIVKFR